MTLFTRHSFIIITSLFLTLPNDALAAKTIEQCQVETLSEIEQSQCFDGIIETLDRELQTWVNHHTFNLEEKALVNGRYSALKMFKRAQSNFITFRENECRWRYLAISPEKGASAAFKSCHILLNQARIKQLSIDN